MGMELLLALEAGADSSTPMEPRSEMLEGWQSIPCIAFRQTPWECTAADNSSGNQMERLDIKLPSPLAIRATGVTKPQPPLLAVCRLT